MSCYLYCQQKHWALFFTHSLRLWSGTIWNFWILQNHRSLRNKGTIWLKILYCTMWNIWNYLKYEILKKTISQTKTFWSIWTKETLPTIDPFSVTYFMKSHVSYWNQKWNIFVIARINQSYFVLKLNYQHMLIFLKKNSILGSLSSDYFA